MKETVAQLWHDILAGTPATDHVVALLGLACMGLGIGALILWDEARKRNGSR
jgi:hypothetical protein